MSLSRGERALIVSMQLENVCGAPYKLVLQGGVRMIIGLHSLDTTGLLQNVDVAVSLIRDGHPGIPVPDYVDENVSTKVVRIIQSYVGVVNKMVWRKF